MTTELIERLAREAGFVDYELDDGTLRSFDLRYARFAALVAEHCAQIADERQNESHFDAASDHLAAVASLQRAAFPMPKGKKPVPKTPALPGHNRP